MTPSSSANASRRAALRSGSLGLLLACALAGCGGEDKGRVSGSMPTVPDVDHCAVAAQVESSLTIVDFDPWDNNGKTADSERCDENVCPANPFYFNHDDFTVLETGVEPICTPPSDSSNGGCDLCPRLEAASFRPPVGSRLPPKPIPEGERCGKAQSALHVEISNMGTCFGTNGRRGWGGSFEIKLLELDASEYDGVSFWVRKGLKPTQASLLLSVVDDNTAGISMGTKGEDHCGCLPISSPDEVPVCSTDPDKNAAFAGFPDSLKCDAFGAAVTLTDDWSFVQAYFSKLHQKGFGKASPLGEVDKAKLMSLQFLIGVGDWDFWLDDVAFFKAPAQ